MLETTYSWETPWKQSGLRLKSPASSSSIYTLSYCRPRKERKESKCEGHLRKIRKHHLWMAARNRPLRSKIILSESSLTKTPQSGHGGTTTYTVPEWVVF